MRDECAACPYCDEEDRQCAHLLLEIDQDSECVIGGTLSAEAEEFEIAFQEIFEEVARRDAVCGRGLLLEATKAFFWNYGYIEFSGELHAELGRDFAMEYLLDVMDCAPNLDRITIESDAETIELIWSDTPDESRRLLGEHLKELRRLVQLPPRAEEWTPVELT